MPQDSPHLDRRALAHLSLLTAAAAALPACATAQPTPTPPNTFSPMPLAPDRPRDFDFLFGAWRVRHRKLKARLAGSNEWWEFDGRSNCWPILGGFGTGDDNYFEQPDGAYHGSGFRAYDRENGTWAIWWLDQRFPRAPADPPVIGRFENGVGTFLSDQEIGGRIVKVRFRWSEITATTATWDQAFSPDGGASWETNWIMHFTRTA